jgi:type IV secretory pathway TraG/TraD family ATPase VirD4
MLQMMQRPLMTADELKSMPKGSFVVMKTGSYPMRTRLKLFFEWGIRFDKPLTAEENMLHPVSYASKVELEEAIRKKHPNAKTEMPAPEMTPLEVHLQEQAKKPDGLVTKTDK